MSADEVTKEAIRCATKGCPGITALKRQYTVMNGKRYLWFPEEPGWTVLGSGHALCPACSPKDAG